MQEGIKLKAEKVEDLRVLSSLLQDAAFKVEDIAYLPKHHRFALVANRFCWEKDVLAGKKKQAKETYHRVRSGLRFEGVLQAGFQNLPVLEKNHVLSLLSIEAKKTKGEFIIMLVFSNSIAIRLKAEMLEVYVEDITGTWQTKTKPTHPVS